MPTGIFLEHILENKRQEVDRAKRETPLSTLEERIRGLPPPANFSGALWGNSVRLIAEVKKASPSKGLLCPNFDPSGLARTYAENGAAVVSVLTELRYFQGTLEHLRQAKEAVHTWGLPVLRKDFIYDPYQFYEARAYGADAALLIVAVLAQSQLQELLDVARSLWVQCLVEVHSEADLEVALDSGVEVVGINHRDLRTFQMDMTLTRRLRPHIPSGTIVVAESGISSRKDVLAYSCMGVNAVLVGESLMTAPDPGAKVRELTGLEVGRCSNDQG